MVAVAGRLALGTSWGRLAVTVLWGRPDASSAVGGHDVRLAAAAGRAGGGLAGIPPGLAGVPPCRAGVSTGLTGVSTGLGGGGWRLALRVVARARFVRASLWRIAGAGGHAPHLLVGFRTVPLLCGYRRKFR
ncbi:hypothetical protein GCM10022248_82300 [Nonomuraea soli]